MKKLISLVLPIYNEAGNVARLYGELDKMSRPAKLYDFEFIFVNDGSQDDSLEALKAIANKDARVTILNFSRNFGQQLAMTAGLDYSKGQAVITMDSDLQDPPGLCSELIKKWQEGYEIVYAKRRSRQGEGLFKRGSAWLFYRLINKLSDTRIPADVGDFRLMDRKVVDELNKFREHKRFMRGLVSYAGFRSTTVEYDRRRRFRGKSNYPLRKMLRLAVDAVTGFSTAPLRLITAFGYLMFLSGLGVLLYGAGLRIFGSSSWLNGWGFVMVTIFIISGLQLVMLGLLGSYIARIYTESQGRPLYIVSSIYSKKSKQN